MELSMRLDILKNAGQISEETYDALLRIIKMFKNKWEIELTEENGAMLITHLSIALERIKKNELVDGIEEETYKEIKNHCQYEQCKNIFKDIMKEAAIEIPINEETFIMMHLCALFESNN
ncbi:PRD domain-containing protein [Candidatus Clostridium radicumherbarum]|uniref:PRD domain-containing protein n=1 Tax=Candidatus Clostridium radicumherbarum TaxID=3381662 RepID=A0ABW8TT06_9CLOT